MSSAVEINEPRKALAALELFSACASLTDEHSCYPYVHSFFVVRVYTAGFICVSLREFHNFFCMPCKSRCTTVIGLSKGHVVCHVLP